MALPHSRRIFDMGREAARRDRDRGAWVLTFGPFTFNYGTVPAHPIRWSVQASEDWPQDSSIRHPEHRQMQARANARARGALDDARVEEALRRRAGAVPPAQSASVLLDCAGLRAVTDILLELATQGHEGDFRFLARSSGVPAEQVDALWRGTVARLGRARS